MDVRLTNRLANDTRRRYDYDRNGNLIRKTETDDDGEVKTRTYTYDYENRLIAVDVREGEDDGTEGKAVVFKYDPCGRRIEKKVIESEDGGYETKTYTYVYDNEDKIIEYLTKTEDGETKTETTRYVHGPGIDEPLAVERKGELYYYHADGLGSIIALTDGGQKTVESYEYTSFGELKRRGDKVKNTFTFTGREWDEEVGLYYYRARYYDAEAGRFVSFDPIVHLTNGALKINSCSASISYSDYEDLKTNPQKFNPYVYVENRPTVLTDPLGYGPPSECIYYVEECSKSGGYACIAIGPCYTGNVLLGEAKGNCVRNCLLASYQNGCTTILCQTTAHVNCYADCECTTTP